jgi:ferric-dicitrate binding protein FerR (iron transport regulator)
MHPSLFELDGFIRRGASSPEFERHVSECAACADQLSRLARRSGAMELVAAPEDRDGRRLQAAAVALAACLAVLLVRTVTLIPVQADLRSRADVSGVGVQEVSMVMSADAGPVDSGVR